MLAALGSQQDGIRTVVLALRIERCGTVLQQLTHDARVALLRSGHASRRAAAVAAGRACTRLQRAQHAGPITACRRTDQLRCRVFRLARHSVQLTRLHRLGDGAAQCLPVREAGDASRLEVLQQLGPSLLHQKSGRAHKVIAFELLLQALEVRDGQYVTHLGLHFLE